MSVAKGGNDETFFTVAGIEFPRLLPIRCGKKIASRWKRPDRTAFR